MGVDVVVVVGMSVAVDVFVKLVIIVVVVPLSSGLTVVVLLLLLSSDEVEEFVVGCCVLIALRRSSLYFRTLVMLSRSENSSMKSAEAERSNVAVIRWF